MKPKKLKRVPLKEELVALTKDYKLAIVLQQMIYWNERCDDFDEFIEEENSRKNKNKEDTELEKMNGWVYKKAEQLSEETLMNVSPKQIIRYLKKIEEKGWIEARNNPKYKWDRTLQYRLNLIKLMTDLNAIGYQLEGYAMFKQEKKETSPKKDPINQPEKDGPKCPVEGTRCPIEKTKKEVQKGQDDGAIPEITIENTSETTSAKQTGNPEQDNDTYPITDTKPRLNNAETIPSDTNPDTDKAEHSRSYFLDKIHNEIQNTKINAKYKETLIAELEKESFVAGQARSKLIDDMDDKDFYAFYDLLSSAEVDYLHPDYWRRFGSIELDSEPPKINRSDLRKKHKIKLSKEHFYDLLDYRDAGFGGKADIVDAYVQHEMKLWDFKKTPLKDAVVFFQKEICLGHPVARHYLNMTPEQRQRELELYAQ